MVVYQLDRKTQQVSPISLKSVSDRIKNEKFLWSHTKQMQRLENDRVIFTVEPYCYYSKDKKSLENVKKNLIYLSKFSRASKCEQL